MAVRYHTNWQGPVSIQWYKDRGLTQKAMVQVYHDGTQLEVDQITRYFSGGRIDVRGEGLGPYGDEIGLPIMDGEDYNNFSKWLDTVETEEMWTLDQLVTQYEKANPKIRWAT